MMGAQIPHSTEDVDIHEDKIEYKYIKSIIENGKEFKDKDNSDKKRFLTKVEEMYYGNITSLNEKLLAIK
jgi:hypothetical protein